MIPGQTFVGVVNGLMSSSGAISVRFLDGAQKAIKVKVYFVLDITLLNFQKTGFEAFVLN